MMTTTNDLSVANEIKNQLGSKALYMMGAKNLMADSNSLLFSIGRNSKRINKIQILLDVNDLYDVKFYNIKGCSFSLIKMVEGVYFDQLHSIIEENTGLHLSL